MSSQVICYSGIDNEARDNRPTTGAHQKQQGNRGTTSTSGGRCTQSESKTGIFS